MLGGVGGADPCVLPSSRWGSSAAIPKIQLFSVTLPCLLGNWPSPRLLLEMQSPPNLSLVLGLPGLAQPGVGAELVTGERPDSVGWRWHGAGSERAGDTTEDGARCRQVNGQESRPGAGVSRVQAGQQAGSRQRSGSWRLRQLGCDWGQDFPRGFLLFFSSLGNVTLQSREVIQLRVYFGG